MNKRRNVKDMFFNTELRSNGCAAVVLCVFLILTSLTPLFSQTTVVASETSFISETSNNIVESLSYSFSFIKPSIEEMKVPGSPISYSTINMLGCMALGDRAGGPAMPVRFVKLLVPPKKTVTTVTVIGEPVEVEINDMDLREHPIFPHQYPVPIGSSPLTEFEFDTNIYNSMDAYPSSIFKEQRVRHCRGYAILSVALSPVQYVPQDGRLFYYPEMIVNIELENVEYINPFYRDNRDDEAWVKKLVHNPEVADMYQNLGLSVYGYPGGLCDPSDDYDYVIITTTHNGLDYWETSDTLPYNWESLMDKHEQDDDLQCTLVTIQDIDACTDYHNPDPLFDDLEAHIREFCKDAYQDWGTSYVFVGGDDEWIPAREMAYDAGENGCWSEHDVDSDLYWSNLDNTFNADRDELWGEYGDAGFDEYSELFIGRITCDEPQDVSNWMTKSFYYADNFDRDYLDNAAFYAGDTGWYWHCEGDDIIDFSAIKGTDDWLGPYPHHAGPYPDWLGFLFGFETWNSENPGFEYDLSVKWTAEPPNPGWRGGNIAAAVMNMKDAIDNDQVTLISAFAHANQYMSMDVYCNSSFSPPNTPPIYWDEDYHNTKPFFLHDQGCHCGDMDAADDGVLHSMLFHGDTELAFACVYNTGYGWGNLFNTNSSSALQEKFFWDYLFDTANNSGSTMNWQLGKAMAYSKDMMAPTLSWDDEVFQVFRAIIQGCTLFGDPAQRLKPPVEPFLIEHGGPYEGNPEDEIDFEFTVSGGTGPYNYNYYIREGEDPPFQHGSLHGTYDNPWCPSYQCRAGFFNLEVQVEDVGTNKVASSETTIYVSYGDLTARIIGERYFGMPGEEIEFSAYVEGGAPPYYYKWNWGDGNFSDWLGPYYGQGPNNPCIASHTYHNVGEMIATLTVKDAGERQDSDDVPVFITYHIPWQGSTANGRSILRIDSDDDLHFVYHDLGYLWYAWSEDLGVTWIEEPIMVGPDTIEGFSFAIDPLSNVPCVVFTISYEYYSQIRNKILYVMRDPLTGWTESQELRIEIFGGVSDLMFDIDNASFGHVLYGRPQNGDPDIIHLRFDLSTGESSVRELDWYPYSYRYRYDWTAGFDLAIDLSGNVHIVTCLKDVYGSQTYDHLVLHEWGTPDNWNFEIVYSTENGFWYDELLNPVIEIESNDDIHIAWYHVSWEDPLCEEVLYRKKSGDIWGDIEQVFVEGNNGNYWFYYHSLVLFNHRPCIVRDNMLYGEILYKARWGLTWPGDFRITGYGAYSSSTALGIYLCTIRTEADNVVFSKTPLPLPTPTNINPSSPDPNVDSLPAPHDE